MNRRGTVMLVTLLLTLMVGMVAATLAFRVGAEARGAAAVQRGDQARAAAMSGLYTAVRALAHTRGFRSIENDNSDWHDNPELFRDRLLYDDGADRWYFTVYAPASAGIRYGVVDETGKIDVNSAPAHPDGLASLPGLEPAMVDSLLDFLDKDSDPRDGGAEQDDYDLLPHPFTIPNGPLVTIEQLALVRGFTGGRVFGEDMNRNGLLEPNEDDGDESLPPDDGNGSLRPPLSRWLTVHSRHANTNHRGEPRVNINGDNLDALDSLDLPTATTAFIKAYRRGGQTFDSAAQLLNLSWTMPPDLRSEVTSDPAQFLPADQRPAEGEARPSWDDVFDLGPGGADDLGAQPGILSSVTPDNLHLVMDQLTTTDEPFEYGLVNVMTASARVLRAVGFSSAEAGTAVAIRGELLAEEARTPAWLLRRGVITDAARFKQLAPRLTCRGQQFRIKCVGYGLPSRRFVVLEAVVDISDKEPRMVYARELTELGPPLAIGGSDLPEMQP